MLQRLLRTSTFAFILAVSWVDTAPAEMGPCSEMSQDNFYCGEGVGAARTIPKTISPSHRLALAWRLTNRPPTVKPYEGDPDLESLIVRISDGAVLVKSHGVYWDLGDRYAPHRYVGAAWSPDSHFLVRTLGARDVSDSADLFAFAGESGVTGPFNLITTIERAARAAIEGKEAADKYLLNFSYQPQLTIDNQGLLHANVFLTARDSTDEQVYELTARVTQSANSFDATVLSVSRYRGPYVSVTVH